MTDINELLARAQEMQQRLAQVQSDLEKRTAEGSAGGGMVKAKVNGARQLVGLTIEKGAVDPSDVGLLQDLVIAAVNQAQANINQLMQDELRKLSGGMPIPGLF